MAEEHIVTTPTIGPNDVFPTSRGISNMDWIRIGRRVRPMSEPFPETAAEVRPWMDRVGKLVQDTIVEELEGVLR